MTDWQPLADQDPLPGDPDSVETLAARPDGIGDAERRATGRIADAADDGLKNPHHKLLHKLAGAVASGADVLLMPFRDSSWKKLGLDALGVVPGGKIFESPLDRVTPVPHSQGIQKIQGLAGGAITMARDWPLARQGLRHIDGPLEWPGTQLTTARDAGHFGAAYRATGLAYDATAAILPLPWPTGSSTNAQK
jgi:hypothetical protein